MKKIAFSVLILATILSCQKQNNVDKLFNDYFEEYLKFNPLDATFQGDNRYNDQLPNTLTQKYTADYVAFNDKYLAELKKINQADLTEEQRLFYQTLKYKLNTENAGLLIKEQNLVPFTQFTGLPLTFAQLGSGEGAQPFKTPKDYENWLKRIDHFVVWADTAIANFNKGVKIGYVLPKTLVIKMIPQMNDLANTTVENSLFYGPIKKIPKEFDDKTKAELTTKYKKSIAEKLLPTYKKLGDYLSKKYLPAARKSSGLGELKGGATLYKYLVNYWTTTNKTPEEIYNTGLAEVTRIKAEMEKIKQQVGFKGDLKAFFEYLKTDPKLMPYKNADEVLQAFRNIQARIDKNLPKLFSITPKTKFEIRRTEAFREASASAEYLQGTADGTRPGIFYVPIPDAKKFNVTSGMESLFLHEAIPGHHYQISLQQENQTIPKFARFNNYGAYCEGWALYCESLGKDLGLYTDPYQYMGALGDEIHRAIRLVVDVGLHTKGWSREQAIKYMMNNEAIAEQGAVAEIERYMAMPAQALSYKIGALKIRELRNKSEKTEGTKFKITDFHTNILKNGSLPLEILENTILKTESK